MDIEQSGHPHQSEHVDVFYDGRTFPFPDASFDGVVCNQVFEHVFNPHTFLSEIHRVLKADGMFLLTVPFVWDEHEQPYDYARYTSFGLEHLLQVHGFQMVAQRKTLGDARVLCQLANLFLYKSSRRLRRTRVGAFLATLVLNAPLNLLGSICWRLFPKNQDFYLDVAVLARKAAGTGCGRALPEKEDHGNDYGR
jgi:SAM-dependent methyltransferase